MNLDLATFDIVLVVGLALCGIAALLAVIFVLRDFQRDLHFINMEIQRTTGSEQRYWLRKRKQLWLSLLPFYRK